MTISLENSKWKTGVISIHRDLITVYVVLYYHVI
jgi:hypothetical protein